MDVLPEELMIIICEYLDLSHIVDLYLSDPIICNRYMNQLFIENLYKKYNCEIFTIKSESVLTLLDDLIHIINVKRRINNIHHFLKQGTIISFLIKQSLFRNVFGKELSNRCYDSRYMIEENIIQQQISQMYGPADWHISIVFKDKCRHSFLISHDIKNIIFKLFYLRVDIKLDTVK